MCVSCALLLLIISSSNFVNGQSPFEGNSCSAHRAYVENFAVYRCNGGSNFYQAGCSAYDVNGLPKFVPLENIDVGIRIFHVHLLPGMRINCQVFIDDPSLLGLVEDAKQLQCFDCRQTDSSSTNLVMCIPESFDWRNVRSMRNNGQRCYRISNFPYASSPPFHSRHNNRTGVPYRTRGPPTQSPARRKYPGWYGNEESVTRDPTINTRTDTVTTRRNTVESNVPTGRVTTSRPVPPDEDKEPELLCPETPMKDLHYFNQNGDYWKSMFEYDLLHNDGTFSSQSPICLSFERIVDNAHFLVYPEIENLIGYGYLSLGFSKLTRRDNTFLYRYKNPLLTTLYVLAKLRDCNFYKDLEEKFLSNVINKQVISEHDFSLITQCPPVRATTSNNFYQNVYQPEITTTG